MQSLEVIRRLAVHGHRLSVASLERLGHAAPSHGDHRNHLVDLVELADLGGRKRVGEAIAEALLLDFRDGKVVKGKKKQQKAVEMVWELKEERAKKEKCMRREEVEARWASTISINRAQCWLLLRGGGGGGGKVFEGVGGLPGEDEEGVDGAVQKQSSVLAVVVGGEEGGKRCYSRALPRCSAQFALEEPVAAVAGVRQDGAGEGEPDGLRVFMNIWLGFHDDDEEQPQHKKRSAEQVLEMAPPQRR